MTADIYVNVTRQRTLYTFGQPEIELGVTIQVYRRGVKEVIKRFHNLTEEQVRRWEALQDKLAAMRQ